MNTFGSTGQSPTPFHFDTAMSTPFQAAFGTQQNTSPAGGMPQAPAMNPLMQSLAGQYHSASMPVAPMTNLAQTPSGNPFSQVFANSANNPLMNHLAFGAMNGSWNAPGYNPTTNYYSQYQAQQGQPPANGGLLGILGGAPAPLTGGQ